MAHEKRAATLRETGNLSMRGDGRTLRAVVCLQGEYVQVSVRWGQIWAASAADGGQWKAS